jgi:hypothetical protein
MRYADQLYHDRRAVSMTIEATITLEAGTCQAPVATESACCERWRAARNPLFWVLPKTMPDYAFG